MNSPLFRFMFLGFLGLNGFWSLGQNAPSDTTRFYNTLAFIKRSVYVDSVEVFKAAKAVEPFYANNTRRKALLYNRLGDFYFYANRFDKALDYYEKSEKLALSIKDSSIFITNEVKKIIISPTFNSLDAEHRLLTYLNQATRNKDLNNIVLCNNALGFIYEDKFNYEKCTYYFLNGLKYAEKIEDPYLIAMILNNLGLAKINHKQYDAGLKDLERGLKYADKFNNPHLEFYLLNNTGIIYNIKKNYKKSIEYYSLTLKKAIAMDNPNQIGTSYYNLSKSYLLDNQNEKAFATADSSIYYLSKLKDSRKLAKPMLVKAHVYFNKSLYGEALHQTNEVLLLIYEVPTSEDKSEAYLLRSKIFKAKNDYVNALLFYQKYSDIKDSIAEKNNLEQITKLQLNYDLDRKEAELQKEKALNAVLEKDKTLLTAQNKLKETRNFLIIAISLFVFIALIVFVYFQQIRTKRKQKAFFTQKLIQSIDNERSRISRDLHDDVGQYLSIVKSKMNAVKNGQIHYVKDIEVDLGTVIDKMREISHTLHPSYLEKIGFKRSVVSLLGKLENVTNLITTYEIDDIENHLTLSQKNHLYRIIQESINNTIKHSNAKAIKIIVKNEEEFILFEYKDNGTNVKESSILNKTKGIGIQTIEERAIKLGGKINFNLNPTTGFSLQIKIHPLFEKY